MEKHARVRVARVGSAAGSMLYLSMNFRRRPPVGPWETPRAMRLIRSLGLCQIGYDWSDIRIVDRRLVGTDHLVHFGLPCRFRKGGLVQHHVRGVTGKTVVVDGVSFGSAGKLLVIAGKLHLHGFQRRQILTPGRTSPHKGP